MDRFWYFTLLWGIWLLVPLAVDGLTTLVYLVSTLLHLYREHRHPLPPLAFHPPVSIIVPVYNSQRTLGALLRSLSRQTYPLDQMEVLLIDNGSTDQSHEVFAAWQSRLPLRVVWHSILSQGKAWALNAGIHLARGTYIANVDSDVTLAPDAIEKMVTYMETHRDVAALTGAIHVRAPLPNASLGQRLLAACEFLEYATAFHVGREAQTLQNNLFTLSGAFSFFRSEVLLQTFQYSPATVSEDTDLTFELYARFPRWRVQSLTPALAFVEPIPNLDALYAQRVRWQRGQFEVSARYPELMRRPFWYLKGFTPARVMLVDHTMSFIRLVWSVFLPALLAFGYPLSLILGAWLAIYVLYTATELLWAGVAWLAAPPILKRRVVRALSVVPLMPLYRLLIFWFRVSGFLEALLTPPSWRAPNPLAQLRAALADLQRRFRASRFAQQAQHRFGCWGASDE